MTTSRCLAGVITDTTMDAVVDLVGLIGRHVLACLMPARRLRTNPRVVKRAISMASTRKRRHRGPSRKATITIDILADTTGP